VAVAALSTPDPKADARGERPAERLRLLRPLGAQSVPAWAALDATVEGSGRLVVAERAQRRAFDDADIADWIRDARRLEALDHPNIARVRGVLIRSHEILVVTEFVDGVRWKELPASAPWAAQLEHVVKRALSADPAKRFASASAMAAELRRIAGPRLPAATL